MLFHLSDVLIKDFLKKKKKVQFLAAFRIIEKLTYKMLAQNIFIIYILLWLCYLVFFFLIKTKFGYKFDCNLKLQFSLK